MKRIRAVPVLALIGLLVPLAAAAQDPGGFRGALLGDMDQVAQKFIALAEAVPAAEYDWRPAEGVRSIGEVYGHIANGNYMISGIFAEGRPADVGVANAPRNLEEVADKADLITLMEGSFEHVRQVIRSTPDSELDNEITMFGQPATVRSAMLLLVTHMHEHLGQSIAYARSRGVTPPWSG